MSLVLDAGGELPEVDQPYEAQRLHLLVEGAVARIRSGRCTAQAAESAIRRHVSSIAVEGTGTDFAA